MSLGLLSDLLKTLIEPGTGIPQTKSHLRVDYPHELTRGKAVWKSYQSLYNSQYCVVVLSIHVVSQSPLNSLLWWFLRGYCSYISWWSHDLWNRCLSYFDDLIIIVRKSIYEFTTSRVTRMFWYFSSVLFTWINVELHGGMCLQKDLCGYTSVISSP